MRNFSVSAEAAREFFRAELARRNLYEFVKFSWGKVNRFIPFQDNWHIGCICEHLQALSEMQLEKLILNCPPRTLKSWLVSVFWPAWEWLRNPSSNLFYASYDNTLSERDADRARTIIKSPWYRKAFAVDWMIKPTADSKSFYLNTENGSRLATTPAGKATGFDADFVIIDDPHNIREARNAGKLMATCEWLSNSLSTRGNNPNAFRILIAGQRVAEGDIHGYALAREMGFEHLCYDRETEILTESGWVRFDRLNKNQKVAQVDCYSREMTFTKPTHYTQYHYSGDMIHFKTGCVDALVTPDHRMVYKNIRERETVGLDQDWKIGKANSMAGNFLVPQACRWRGTNRKKIKISGISFDVKDFCKFMGIWISEGCVRLGNRREIVISQDSGPVCDKIDALLKKIGLRFSKIWQGESRKNHYHFVIKSGPIYRYLLQFGKSGDKFVPNEIKELSVKNLEIFLEWYGMGDGHVTKRNSRSIHYVSKSDRLIDDIQEILIKCNRTGGVGRSVNCSRITSRAAKTKNGGKWYGLIRPHQQKRIKFNDEVFCVTVPSGAILVRRNGKPFVSGNCLPMEWEPKRFFHSFEEAKAVGAVDPVVMTSVQKKSESARDPRTEEGEIIHKERFSQKRIADLKAALQATGAAGQLQQRPAPSEGTIFSKQMFRYYELKFSKKRGKSVFVLHRGDGVFDIVPVDECLFAQCIDTALTDKEQSSYTAAATIALTPQSDLIVFNIWREHLQVPYQYAALKELRKGPIQWDAEAKKTIRLKEWPRPLAVQAIEPKASGIGLLQQFKMEGSPLVELPTDGDKVLRCGPVAAMYFNQKVFHPMTANWKETFENELLVFPTGAHDDLVDVIAHSAYLVQNHRLIQAFLRWDPVNGRRIGSEDSVEQIDESIYAFDDPDGCVKIDLSGKV